MCVDKWLHCSESSSLSGKWNSHTKPISLSPRVMSYTQTHKSPSRLILLHLYFEKKWNIQQEEFESGHISKLYQENVKMDGGQYSPRANPRVFYMFSQLFFYKSTHPSKVGKKNIQCVLADCTPVMLPASAASLTWLMTSRSFFLHENYWEPGIPPLPCSSPLSVSNCLAESWKVVRCGLGYCSFPFISLYLSPPR